MSDISQISSKNNIIDNNNKLNENGLAILNKPELKQDFITMEIVPKKK